MNDSPSQVWSKLAALKSPLLTRCEQYASLTFPRLLLPEGFNKDATGQTHDYQSVGAQAVNHLTNKIMLALFAPSRPFFRVNLTPKIKAELQATIGSDAEILAALGEKEREAIRELDATGHRPKLYNLIRHLIVTGNGLLVLKPNGLRVMSIKYYCTKRDIEGKLHTLSICEEVCFNELDPEVQAAMPASYKDRGDGKVKLYKLIERTPDGKGYTEKQAVDETLLPAAFQGRYSLDDLPYIPMFWDLADDADYGTGLVEEYEGDFEALSALSESVVDGAIIGAEVRYLVAPTGQTSADDLNNSKNGDFINGNKGDIDPVSPANMQAVKQALDVMQHWEQRIARGFLLYSAMTRDAERVTAEEIRQTAQELETAFGGVYSSLALQVQTPIAYWLLKRIKFDVKGSELQLAIVTGLDALSRNGDLDNLRMALADLAAIATLPPMLMQRLDFDKIVAFVGNGRGVPLADMMRPAAEVQAENDAAIETQVAADVATAAGTAAVQQGTQ